MKHDEKQFLELLEPYKTDDTRKARRNLSTISFIVIAAWLLGVKLSAIRLFGADLSKSSELLVLGIALLVVVYWSAMFYLSWTHDSEIQRERIIQGNEAASAINERYKSVEEQRKKNEGRSGYIPMDYHEVVSAAKAYERQVSRTARAAKYERTIRWIELYVPFALALFALAILCFEGIRTLGL